MPTFRLVQVFLLGIGSDWVAQFPNRVTTIESGGENSKAQLKQALSWELYRIQLL